MKEKTLQMIPQNNRTVIEYNEQLYTNKLDSLEKIDKFLEIHNLPRLTNEETKSVLINN